MRALIMLLCAVVVALSALILLDRPAASEAGSVFDATQLIADAHGGEEAVYRDERGETWTFRVESAIPGGVDRPPRIRIWSIRRDHRNQPLPGGTHVYNHLPTRHGLFPLMAPADPDGYDRVWVWEHIRRVRVPWKGRERDLWRVDLIDPALPEEGDAGHVVAWLDEAAPVFGLVRWQRRDRTWSLVNWEAE